MKEFPSVKTFYTSAATDASDKYVVWESDLVMAVDKYGDNGESEDKHQGDAEKNDKHLPTSNS